MKSNTPRRVVEVIARTLGARYSNLCHRISNQTGIGYLGDSIQAWSGDDLRQAHRPELYREELGALSKYYGPEAGWIDGGLFCFFVIPAFRSAEIASFVFSLGAKLFFRLRCCLRVGSKNQLKNVGEGHSFFCNRTVIKGHS